MPEATIITEDVRTVEAGSDGDRLVLAREALPDAIGWELKPEGLCREGVCVPVRDQSSLLAGDGLDVAAVAAALGRPVVIDAGAAMAAIGLPGELRSQALTGLRAPSFTLPDLDGTPHSLEEWHGRKKLLVAFASW